MRENVRKNKTKAMLVIIVMLLSVTVAFVMIAPIARAAKVYYWDSVPAAFSITAPVNGSHISGNYTITWDVTNASSFNVSIWSSLSTGDPVKGGQGWTYIGNVTSPSYVWDTTNVSDGEWYINVTAHSNVSHGGNFTNATNGPVRVWVRNTMPGTPGFDIWQGGNFSICWMNKSYVFKKPLSTSTKLLEYGETVNITVNSSVGINDHTDHIGWEADTYYLYYPCYVGKKGSGRYDLSWKRYVISGQPDPSITNGTDWIFENIELNASGLWVIDNTDVLATSANFSNITNFNASVPAWFWVNSSDTYTLELSAASFDFNSTGAITGTVKNPDVTTAAIMDIRYDYNESSIMAENRYSSTGVFDTTTIQGWYKNVSFFWGAGNYTAYVYLDADDWGGIHDGTQYYLENNMDKTADGNRHYNSTYGSNAYKNATATTWANFYVGGLSAYNWPTCGPWDPPEYNTSNVAIVVDTGTPTWSIPAANLSMYYNFSGEVNISVTEPTTGAHIQEIETYVYNDAGENVSGVWAPTSNNITMDNSTAGDGYIQINSSNWGVCAKDWTLYGENGTWSAYVFSDLNNDGIQEWNTTVYWDVVSPAGVLRFTWIDDDGPLGTTSVQNTDGVIPWVPPMADQPVTLKFMVQNADHEYLGNPENSETATAASKLAARKNITLTGDALFLEDGTQTLEDLPTGSVWFSGTEWWVNITPLMALNGGELTLAVEWGSYGSTEEVLTIGGDDLYHNGTIVTISPTEFTYDQNVTFTVTVTGYNGVAVPNADVYLYWLQPNASLATEEIEWTDQPTVHLGNVYTFVFNTTEQRRQNSTAGFSATQAPRNVTAYAGVDNVGYGYAKATMNAISDLKVTAAATGLGTGTELELMAGKEYRKIWFNTTEADGLCNSTGWPTSATDLKVRVYNETGVDVTGRLGKYVNADAWDAALNASVDNKYLTTPGTYAVFAKNNTHDSKGCNATLIITMVDVTSNISEFIWGFDKNISAEFTIKYKGEPVNGTLRIDNISRIGSAYNKTWTNTSFNNVTGTDTGGNISRSHTITNGQTIVYDITANNLSEQRAGRWYHYSSRDITFYFKPKESGSTWAKASGSIPVKIPDVSASPASIPFDIATKLELTITGRGTGLADVFVDITVPGVSGRTNGTTDDQGITLFSVRALSVGNIVIRVENRTSDTTVPVTSWSLYLDAPSQTNEGESFTVTVKNGTAAGAAVADATITFNKQIYKTGTDGTKTILATDVPNVTANKDYTIVATKTGHAEDSATITVVNVPKLSVVAPSTVTAESTFDVVVADDAGNSIVGATITLDGTTYTSGAQGIAKLTAPSAGTYTITASKTGFITSVPVTITVTAKEEPGIPGFELLTLIAAIGVAFILLRRRRH